MEGLNLEVAYIVMYTSVAAKVIRNKSNVQNATMKNIPKTQSIVEYADYWNITNVKAF